MTRRCLSRAVLSGSQARQSPGGLTALAVCAWLGLWSAHAQAQTTSDQTRASSFTYYQLSDGALNGLLKTETVEPNNPQLCVTTTYTYDAYGNKSVASTANCPGATGNALFTPRTSRSAFAAQTVTVAAVSGVVVPAGAFATTSTNALSQSENRTYDPRFGTATSLTGPNSLTTNWVLDDFGRAVMETRADGTRTVSYYCYISGRQVADISSNSPGCAGLTFASSEVPADAIAFVHTESRDSSAAPGSKNGPFSRVYNDRAGRKIRTVTEAFDGASQPGGTNRLIVQDADYSPYGPQVIATQPYFLDSNSSVSTGSTTYGMRRTDYDVLGRPIAVYTADVALTSTVGGIQGGNQGGSQTGRPAFGSRGSSQASVVTIAYNGLNTTTTDDPYSSATDNAAHTRFEERNVDGKVVRVTDALGAQVAYQHDAFGNLVTTQDARQNLATKGGPPALPGRQ